MINHDFIIPLGMRCNSAGVVRHLLKYNQPSMVFDWTQFSLETMIEIINLERSEIEDYFEDYFSATFIDARHPEKNDWLPHDFDDDIDIIKAKFIRRTNRLFDYFEHDQIKKFLITFSIEPQIRNLEYFEKIRDTIIKRINEDYIFLTVNCGNIDINNEKHKNISINVKTWKELDEKIKNWILFQYS